MSLKLLQVTLHSSTAFITIAPDNTADSTEQSEQPSADSKPQDAATQEEASQQQTDGTASEDDTATPDSTDTKPAEEQQKAENTADKEDASEKDSSEKAAEKPKVRVHRVPLTKTPVRTFGMLQTHFDAAAKL